MAGVCKKRQPNKKYRAWYIDAAGKQRFFMGTTSKVETLRMAERLEDEQRQIRLGYRPAPRSAEKHRNRAFEEVVGEYLGWGAAQGGRGGRPWSKTHARVRRAYLRWWQGQLGLQTLADLEDDLLARTESILRELQAGGRAGKTLNNIIESLHSFCNWCVKRGYLMDDPLKNFIPFDKTPQSIRRAMTVEEIGKLLAVAPEHRRLLYEVALCSGLRAGELRSLSVDDLDMERCGIHLDAAWTKNRKPGFQPLPRNLVERLWAFAESGRAKELYQRHYARRDAKLEETPEEPLLFVSARPIQEMEKDLSRAQIPKQTMEGKLDFHCLRVTYITLVSESGASTKELQHLARHSTPTLTLNVYARTREDRLSQLAEAVGKKVESTPYHAVCMQKQAAGAEGLGVSALSESVLGRKLLAGTCGSRTHPGRLRAPNRI